MIKAIQIVFMAITVIGVAFPMLWMLSTSFKSPQEVTASPPTLLPQIFTTNHFTELFQVTHYGTYLVNSIIVTICVTLISILIACLGGYALSRNSQAGWMKLISRSVLLSYVFPQILLVVPIFLILKSIGLTDSLVGLILTDVTLVLPFSLMLLKSYFDAIPRDYEEAAMVDGANQAQVLYHIAFPMAFPGIISTAIFGFIEGWNEFLFALILISSDSKKTIAVGISSLLGGTAIYSWGMIMAAAVCATVPAFIFFMFVQRRLVEGQLAGGIKG